MRRNKKKMKCCEKFVLTIDQIKEEKKVLCSKGKLVTHCSKGLSEAFSIELDSVRGVAAFSQEVVVLLLEPSEEKHDILLVRHVLSCRSVRCHVDEIAFEVAHMW